MSQEEEVSTVGDHNEKMAKRGGKYRSKHEEGGAGDAKEACFQTHKNGRNRKKKNCGGMPAPDKQQPNSGRLARPVLNEELVDQFDDRLTITQFCIVKIGKVLFLYLNGKVFYKTGRPGAGFWRCKNKWCDAYISATTYDTTTAELRLDTCRFEHSAECIEYEAQPKEVRQKESQSLLLNNLSSEAPGSLEEAQYCINDRNSHGSHSTNTLDSKADEQIKDDEDVPKEIAPLLKNDSLCRITPTDDFNEPQPPAASPEKPLKEASNTNSDSNISTNIQTYASILILIGLIIWIFLFIILLLHGNGFNFMLYSPMINRFTIISNRHKLSKNKAKTIDYNACITGRDTTFKSNNNTTTKEE